MHRITKQKKFPTQMNCCEWKGVNYVTPHSKSIHSLFVCHSVDCMFLAMFAHHSTNAMMHSSSLQVPIFTTLYNLKSYFGFCNDTTLRVNGRSMQVQDLCKLVRSFLKDEVIYLTLKHVLFCNEKYYSTIHRSHLGEKYNFLRKIPSFTHPKFEPEQ